ncbi:MAG: HEAT repeat protein, partial [Planctomycetota bacterium]
EHENCRTQAVAKALIAALDDPALRVRTKVLGMLVDGQHAELTITTLVSRLGDIKKNMWSLVDWLRGKQGVHGSVDDAMGYIERLMEVSGEVPDDRVVKALANALKAMPTEMRGQPVAMSAVHALLELGTRDAVATVIKQFKPRPPSKGAVENIHSALEDFALELEIEDYPEFDGDLKKLWESWARKNSSRIPTKLGRWIGKPLD